MMAKKQARAPYRLEVLTTEYLVEGTVEGDSMLYFPEVDMQDSPPLRLASVHLESTGRLKIPAGLGVEFIVMGENAVALVPRTEAAELPQYGAWKVADVPVEGVFYFGPYVMRGKLMLLRNGLFSSEMPMFNVQVESAVEGAQWRGLEAPFAIVNGGWLHGYEPA